MKYVINNLICDIFHEKPSLHTMYPIAFLCIHEIIWCDKHIEWSYVKHWHLWNYSATIWVDNIINGNHSDIWVNYNDFTTTSLEIMVSKGNHPQTALIQVSELL